MFSKTPLWFDMLIIAFGLIIIFGSFNSIGQESDDFKLRDGHWINVDGYIYEFKSLGVCSYDGKSIKQQCTYEVDGNTITLKITMYQEIHVFELNNEFTHMYSDDDTFIHVRST